MSNKIEMCWYQLVQLSVGNRCKEPALCWKRLEDAVLALLNRSRALCFARVQINKEIMMKRFALFAILSVLLFPAAVLAAKNPQYKFIIVKPLTTADGVTLPVGAAAEFTTHLRDKLLKTNFGSQVVEEGSNVAAADAADSIVIEANVTVFKPVSKTGSWVSVIAETNSSGTFKVEISIFRLSDHTLIKTITPKLEAGGCLGSSCENEQRKTIAFEGEVAADAIRKALK
jgi:hypothetical protein